VRDTQTSGLIERESADYGGSEILSVQKLVTKNSMHGLSSSVSNGLEIGLSGIAHIAEPTRNSGKKIIRNCSVSFASVASAAVKRVKSEHLAHSPNKTSRLYLLGKGEFALVVQRIFQSIFTSITLFPYRVMDRIGLLIFNFCALVAISVKPLELWKNGWQLGSSSCIQLNGRQ